MRKFTRWGGVLSALAIGGCSFARPIAKDALEINERFAQTRNQEMLLNVARASMKHPLYFTSVSSLSRQMSDGASVEPNFVFGNGKSAASGYEFGPRLEVRGTTNASIGVLDSDEFMKGITTPIKMETLKYYWDQGWWPELLLRLLVRRIVEKDGTSYDGHLDAQDGFRGYRRYLDRIRTLASKARLKKGKGTPEALGPAIDMPKSDADLLRVFLEAAKQRVEIVATGDNQIILKGAPESTWSFDDGVGKPAAPATLEIFRDAMSDKRSAADSESSFYLRSPEAILSHLGEIARTERLPNWDPSIMFMAGTTRALFTTRGGPGCCGVTVEYCGETYSVPGDPATSESMRVLSFLSQLLALQKKASDLPKDGVVTVLGGR